MLRRLLVGQRPFHAGKVRQMVVFSQQSPVLTANQKSRNSTSNLWIETWDADRGNFARKPDDSRPTIVMLDKQVELLNLDQIANPPNLLNCPRHSSYSTKKPYGTKLQLELDNRAVTQGFQSKWWLTRNVAKKENMFVKPRAASSIMLVRSNVELLHSSQFVNSQELQLLPVSGSSRRVYAKGSGAFDSLVLHAQNNNYRTGLYYTRKQLELLGLAPKAAELPLIEQSTGASEVYKWYNVEQLEEPEVALQTLNRAPVDVPTFLLSGEPIEASFQPTQPFTSNYYLSGRDAELYGWALRQGQKAHGHHLSAAKSEISVEFFNVDQLTDPEEGFKKAGLIVK